MCIGIVVIGRNEGERLRRCLSSVTSSSCEVVYVDSGSTDGSVMLAKSMSVAVVELDMSTPFSAARARNSGFEHLLTLSKELKYIQFLDGDCEISVNWLDKASGFLDTNRSVAIVTGRLSERFPEFSIYNRLANFEWNSSEPGEVEAVGGIFMARISAFSDVGGFDESVYAGEEPELCHRIIQRGWKIMRIDYDMALHDLAMSHFSEWWQRQVRGGYGGLDVSKRFGLKGFKKNSWRARFWFSWPFIIILGLVYGGGLIALLIMMLWPMQLMRIAFRTWRSGSSFGLASAYAWFTMFSFWPQFYGQIYYFYDWLMSRKKRLIEYKKLKSVDSNEE